jgi:hypothetical protein
MEPPLMSLKTEVVTKDDTHLLNVYLPKDVAPRQASAALLLPS